MNITAILSKPFKTRYSHNSRPGNVNQTDPRAIILNREAPMCRQAEDRR